MYHLKTIFRNIKRHPGYHLLNPSGIIVGITCCLLIFFYISFEFSYDRYHDNAENIYRVVVKHSFESRGTDMFIHSPGPLAPTLKEEFPEILRAARVRRGSFIFNSKESTFYENRLYFVDQEFMDIFSYPLISGDAKTCLSEPFSLVLTEGMAKKYFGNDDPLGKRLVTNNSREYTITGIIEKVPENSHFLFDFLVSTLTYRGLGNLQVLENWEDHNFVIYIQLQQNTSHLDLERKLPEFIDRNSQGDYAPVYKIQPLTDIHFYGKFNDEFSAHSDIRYIFIFSAAAFLILLIACFNYINLSTARSENRAREIGINKVLGASTQKIVFQLSKDLINWVIIANIIAWTLTYYAMHKWLENFAYRTPIQSWTFLAGSLVAFIIAIITVSYKAIKAATANPVDSFDMNDIKRLIIRCRNRDYPNNGSLWRSNIGTIKKGDQHESELSLSP